eukprot:CAMPEP_0118893616 /NCGR_PEP_ID=MMETSP1166-20130328/2755_1 /TAXON_ID=1104430 /ORGANISM="Chrysoreinhardia sp, Strain CCMP3193" /LENGTH=556 /DNA_ID=CAMNT_0006832445 /DNA_START=20 /DNA_END=1690 /DNA_ORIENTATION=+
MDADAEQRSLREQLEEANRRVERLARERDAAADERDAVARERDAAEERGREKQRKVDDTASRPLYDRLNISWSVIDSGGAASATSERTAAPRMTPGRVERWTFQVASGAADRRDDLATLSKERPVFQDFRDRPFDMSWSESDMEAHFMTRVVMGLHDQLIRCSSLANSKLSAQLRNAAKTIPDFTLYRGPDFNDGGHDEMNDCTMLVFESKRPKNTYSLRDERDLTLGGLLAAYIEETPTADRDDPVTQIYEYMCVAGVTRGVLSSGAETFFLYRTIDAAKTNDRGILYVSQSWKPSDETPSLLKALASYFMLSTAGDAKLKAPSKLNREQVNFLKNQQRKERREESQRRAAEQSSEEPPSSTTAPSSTEQKTPSALLAPSTVRLDGVFSIVNPTEEYGPLNYGVAMRLTVWGTDCVVKLVDAVKERRGLENLRKEAKNYHILHNLCGVSIPHLVFAADLNMGRYGIATTYAGRTLDRDPSLLTHNVYQQTVSAIQTLHKAGYLHGDVAPRNIAVKNGIVLLIDLGSARRSDDPAEFALELQEAALLFGVPSNNLP